jgi:hypothetical protein
MTELDDPLQEDAPGPVVFLSASVPDGLKDYPEREHHFETARPQWIRDAVLAISRAALRRGFRIRFGAHPSISPMVLAVAREFPPAPVPPVEVYQSKFFHGRYAPETYELACPPLGILVETDAAADKDTSVRQMRDDMLSRPGLIAAVFVGGMDGVIDEAKRFRDLPWKLPAYAIASAGGGAADLYDPQQPLAFAGGAIAPVDPDLLSAERIGYTRVAREIFDSIEQARGAGLLRPTP